MPFWTPLKNVSVTTGNTLANTSTSRAKHIVSCPRACTTQFFLFPRCVKRSSVDRELPSSLPEGFTDHEKQSSPVRWDKDWLASYLEETGRLSSPGQCMKHKRLHQAARMFFSSILEVASGQPCGWMWVSGPARTHTGFQLNIYGESTNAFHSTWGSLRGAAQSNGRNCPKKGEPSLWHHIGRRLEAAIASKGASIKYWEKAVNSDFSIFLFLIHVVTMGCFRIMRKKYFNPFRKKAVI